MASLYSGVSGFQFDSSLQPMTQWQMLNAVSDIPAQYLSLNTIQDRAWESQRGPLQTFNMQNDFAKPFTFSSDAFSFGDLSYLSLSDSLLAKAGLQPEQAGQIASSIVKASSNAGKVSEAELKYYNRMNTANKIAAGTDILSGVSGLIGAYQGRDTVRITNQQLDVQKTLIDTNISNREAVSNEQFRNSIADLQVLTAAKNVDIRSQAVRSDVVQGGEALGQDMALTRVQGSLQKKAIDFQKAMNNAQQAANEKQAWINFGASLMSATSYFI